MNKAILEDEILHLETELLALALENLLERAKAYKRLAPFVKEIERRQENIHAIHTPRK